MTEFCTPKTQECFSEPFYYIRHKQSSSVTESLQNMAEAQVEKKKKKNSLIYLAIFNQKGICHNPLNTCLHVRHTNTHIKLKSITQYQFNMASKLPF